MAFYFLQQIAKQRRPENKKTFFKIITINNIKKVEIDKKRGEISRNRGLFLLSVYDKSIGYTKELFKCLEDKRGAAKIKHTKEELMKQKILGLIAGYEDNNDYNQLRKDEMIKLCVWRRKIS